MSTKRIFSILIKCFGILLFIIILNKIDVSSLFKLLNKDIIAPLLITIALLIVSYLFKALRWNLLCKAYDIDISIVFSFRVFLVGTFLGFTTPGRMGELFRAYYLKEQGHSLSKSVFSVVLDRLIDLCFLMVFVIISIVFLELKYGIINQVFKIDSYLPLIILTIGVAGLIAGWFFIKNMSWFLEFKEKLKEYRHAFLSLDLNNADKLLLIIYTLIGLFIGYGLFYYLAVCLNINIGFFDILACAFFVSMIQLLPISILGIGTRDITLIYFFNLNSIGAEWAVLLSAVLLIANVGATIPGMFVFIAHKAKYTNIIDKGSKTE
ncbi:MAG TPA: flippase-like domain-containing protein [Bacteroidetes bacterium]|nr:flippase-like domain-containing protein [Bacteroidota bacterium]